MARNKRLLVWLGAGLGAALVVAALLIGGAAYVFSTLVDSESRDEERLRAQWGSPFPPRSPAVARPTHPKAFGSGHFGEWVIDRFGLPAYAYDCEQTSDPRAVTPVHPAWQSPTNHWHQLGNDRLVAIASNYGYVQVREDEGGPKLLNDYDPKRQRFGGGFGYLSDGQVVLSTYYPGHAETFERVFGLGYLGKRVSGRGLVVEQVVFAPTGDDPLVVSQVEIENRRERAVDLRWVEYWDAGAYQLSFRSLILSLVTGGRVPAAEHRRALARSFSAQAEPRLGGRALVSTTTFTGYDWRSRAAWGMAARLLKIPGAREAEEGISAAPSFDDLRPPPVFLLSLDGPADGMATDGRRFFGRGGLASPDGMAAPLSRLGSTVGEGPGPGGAGDALFLERRVRLEPGARHTLRFAFGYLPDGVTLEALAEKYAKDVEHLWERSTRAWNDRRIELHVPGSDWVDRELLWHGYYLGSSLTYDDFFGEHILSQGNVYQYLMGFQGAARDPLQHALPLVYTRPGVVKEVLRYTLKEAADDGAIPYGIVGHGMIMPAPYRPSDQQIWLLWLAGEYVLATRDLAFLDEELPAYPVHGPSVKRESVRARLDRCYRYLIDVTGTGRHGLVRLSNGDWNDGAVLGFVPRERVADVRRSGESVLNAAFASYVLDLYARMLSYSGAPLGAKEAAAKAEEQRQAVREQWAGRWFRRQWLTDDLGWIGDDVLWLEPQPWAIIGGAATAEQRTTLVESIDRLVRRPSPIGAILHSEPLGALKIPRGELVNAGVWPSINGTLVWALARVDGALAWDEWRKNTLARHAEAYPDVWYGIWSGPDSYNSVHSSRPGQTYVQSGPQGAGEPVPDLSWTDFPVMNLHPHAWPLYDVPKLLGFEWTGPGLEIAPTLPHRTFDFRSPLVGLRKADSGYSGWYAPSSAGEWEIVLRLPASDADRPAKLTVNGDRRRAVPSDDGTIRFRGASTKDSPLRWTLEWGRQVPTEEGDRRLSPP